MRKICLSSILMLAVVVLLGCAGRNTPPLGKVTGTVTLDGQPLPKAKILFQPTGEGAPSYGRTDETGRYELQYSVDIAGALVGEHKVRITTYMQEQVEGQAPKEYPERVPPKYNTQTELIKTVESGSQEIDFQLTGALDAAGG